jgi:hypothetical protein
MPTRGVCPAASTVRMVVGRVMVFHCAELTLFNSEAGYAGKQSKYTTFYPNQSRLRLSLHSIAAYYVWVITAAFVWAPRKYGTRSFYHRYCCEYFPHGRIARIACISFWGLGMSWILVPAIQCIPLMTNADEVMQIFPIIVFGLKRLQFILNITINLDDGPFKNYTFVCQGASIFGFISFFVAQSALSSVNLGQIIQFLILDWLACFFRMVLLLRLGSKAFPGLLRFLLSKSLENVPRPMYNSAAHMGDATSMRLHQAYLCLLEGLTLSMGFFTSLIVFLMVRYVYQDTIMITMFPSKNVLTIFLFIISDVIQDLLTEHILKKFSNWSFIFHGLFRGFFAPFMYICFFVVTYWTFAIIPNYKIKQEVTGAYAFYSTNYETPCAVETGTVITQK